MLASSVTSSMVTRTMKPGVNLPPAAERLAPTISIPTVARTNAVPDATKRLRVSSDKYTKINASAA